MDTVVFDGVQYVKASVAATQFRYTSDYIGQLCRQRKIDARLVGRTWFVNVDSIQSHRKSKYQTKRRADTGTIRQTDQQSTEESTERPIKVAPVIKNRTAKTILHGQGLAPDGTPSERQLRVRYEPDDESLVPHLIKKEYQPPRRVVVRPAGAERVSVKSTHNSQVAFETSELPTVALSGKLEVTTYPDLSEVEAYSAARKDIKSSKNNKQNKAIFDKKEITKSAPKALKTTTTSVAATDSQPIRAPEQTLPPTKPKQKQLQTNAQVVAMKRLPQEKSFALATSPTKRQPQTIPTVMLEPAVVPLSIRTAPLAATVVALIFVGILFSASSSVITGETGYESRLTFQVANLIEFIRQ